MEIREPRKVKISGKEYPISFTSAAVSYVSESTGLTFKEVNSFGEDVPIHILFKLIHAGLRNGHRLQHKFNGTTQTEFIYGWEDVTDMLDQDEQAIEDCMKIWAESNQQNKTEEDKPEESEEESGNKQGGKQDES